MISSEVQRTLVKSPPELWAELSDPDSLGRHLGELGEIKITRVEPEKLVEWEAAGVTGKVAIKASGWGTRVTLTVEREVAEPAAESDVVSQAEEPDEAKPAAEAEPAAEADPTAEAEIAAPDEPSETIAAADDAVASAEEPEAVDEPEPANAQEAETLVEPETAIVEQPEAYVAEEPDEGPTPVSGEVRPAPATEAARRAAGLQPPERAEEEPAEPSADASAPEEAPAADASAPEPRRRGFFARLFGTRRKRPRAESHGPSATEDPSSTATTVAGAPIAAEPEASSEHVPGPHSEVTPAAPEPPTAETETAPIDAETATEPEAATDEETRCPETPQAEDGAAAETQAPAEEPAAAAPPEPDPEAGGAKDLAAELEAAEESATAEVTAILTGVLDRLGAAHHRPFSRA